MAAPISARACAGGISALIDGNCVEIAIDAGLDQVLSLVCYGVTLVYGDVIVAAGYGHGHLSDATNLVIGAYLRDIHLIVAATVGYIYAVSNYPKSCCVGSIDPGLFRSCDVAAVCRCD